MKSNPYHRILCMLSLVSALAVSCKKDPDNGNPGDAVIEICEKTETYMKFENHRDGVDYLITCDLNITSGELEIQYGTTVAVRAGKTIRVYNDGALRTWGLSDKPVTFQPEDLSVGASWGGIVISNNNAANRLQQTIIDRAGAVNVNADMGFNTPFDIEAGVAVNGRCNLTGVTVKQSGGVGIYVSPQSYLNAFNGLTVENAAGYPLLLPTYLVKDVVNPSNGGNYSFTGNPAKVYVWGEFPGGSVNWNPMPVPYLIADDITLADGGITVKAGTVIEMETDKGIYVPSTGGLQLEGTPTAPVVIRGRQNLAGWWKGILIESYNPLNVWTNTELANGGSVSMTGFGSGTKATLYLGGNFEAPTYWQGTDIHIRDGEGCGILREGSQVNYTGNNVTFSNTGSEICDE